MGVPTARSIGTCECRPVISRVFCPGLICRRRCLRVCYRHSRRWLERRAGGGHGAQSYGCREIGIYDKGKNIRSACVKSGQIKGKSTGQVGEGGTAGKDGKECAPAWLATRACPTGGDGSGRSSSASGMLMSLSSARLAVEGRGERLADWERAWMCGGGRPPAPAAAPTSDGLAPAMVNGVASDTSSESAATTTVAAAAAAA